MSVENEENEKEFERLKKGAPYKKIQISLLEQLENAGCNGEFYIDLVKDYMDMWITKTLLVKDIKERGVRVFYNNGGGQSGYRKNDSVDQRLKVNAQMMKILNELNISPAETLGDEDEDL